MKVSILIPVYNSEKYIAETLENALAQTWADKEIIVIDDGSTDNSLKIAQSYECDILKVYSQPNKGASAARNYAFAQATGEYIQYLDADDLMSADKIEKQLGFISQFSDYKKVLVYSPIEIFENDITNLVLPNTTIRDKSYDSPLELLNDFFLTLAAIIPHAYLVHRSLIEKSGGWNESLSTNDDGEFFSRVIALSSCVKYVPDTTVYYRNTPNSLSKLRSQKHYESQLLSLMYTTTLMLQKNSSETTKKACVNIFGCYINGWFPGNKPFLKKLEKHLQDNNLQYYDMFYKNAIYIYVSKLLGWRKTLLLRKYCVKYIKKIKLKNKI